MMERNEEQEQYLAPKVEEVMTLEDIERQVQYAGRVTVIPQ